MTIATGDPLIAGAPPAAKPPVVSSENWQTAWEQILVKGKAQLRRHDALAAERCPPMDRRQA